ncbi:hypothetical protein ASD99_01030 [Mesorhizobium sp. Root695]|uniref:hypothetical protein n=1 Tax=unclassified Mesorhizobium TaxID=325217 RepID=UPI0006F58F78|nr:MULTISPECIES: hypothetical protein [unclassified Mesorhizobium]KRB34248.1 hypothetical protein ASD99_01030 [Mesorhizobium sp. Root695]
MASLGDYRVCMTQRYKSCQEPAGTWIVNDALTGRPAEMGSRTIVGMNRQDAEEIADLLSKLDAQRRETRS